jgi:signal transduction histidine kinase
VRIARRSRSASAAGLGLLIVRRRDDDVEVTCLDDTAATMVGAPRGCDPVPMSQLSAVAIDALGPAIRQVLATGELGNTELHWFGAEEIERMRCVLIPTEDGALVVLDDVSEQHRERDALAAAERKLAQLQEWGRVGFWELDMETDEVYWSTQAFEILHLRTSSLAAFVERVHPDDRALIDHVTARARAQPGPYRATHRVVDGDDVRVMQHNMQSIVGDDGRPHRLLGFVTDVTAESAVEEQLRRASSQQSIALLAGGIVHDLNNAFAVVHGHAQLGLQAVARGDAIDAMHLEAIGRAAESAKSLTRSLLSLGRQEALAPRRFSPADMLERVAAMARATLGSRRDVRLRSDAPELDLVTDAGRLERVLVDLVVNARDALPDHGGSVEIRFARTTLDDRHELVVEGSLAPGLYAEVSVVDDGSGIDEATLDRVLEPFFTTKALDAGSGIGLASANAFAQRSGGALLIDSQPGVGTEVKILLPAIDRTPERGSRLVARRVLVATADAGRRGPLCDAVVGAGFQVVAAATADAALTVLRTEPIDMVLADDAVGATLERSSRWRAQHAGTTGLVMLIPPGWVRPPGNPAVVLADTAGNDVVAGLVARLLEVRSGV